MIYYGTRLSENISRREPEGYLFCLNVPVARTGTQEYLPEELGIPPGELHGPSPGGTVSVFRPEEEVFSPETIASFEGMPVTDNHPATEEGVTLENNRYLQKGHAHNIRRGHGPEADLLLADLIITDARLIDQILNEGKREISCGYTYELSEENGQYIQRKIRGNHVAVVDAGRAGPRVSIRDRKPPVCEDGGLFSRIVKHSIIKPCFRERSTLMKKSLYKKLVRLARDGDPEAVEAVAEIVETLTENTPETLPVVPEGTAAAPVAAAPVVGMPAVPANAMVAAVPGTSAAPVTMAPVAAAPVAAYGAVPAAAPVPNAVYAPAQAAAVTPAPVAAPAVPVAVVPAEAPAADPEKPETGLDCDLAAEILNRLDQLIALLTAAAPAADEDPDNPDDPSRNCDDDPIEEIVEAVEEAVEAAIAAENPDAPVLNEEGESGTLAEEINEVIQEIVDPSGILEPEETGDCGSRVATEDAVNAVLAVVRPRLKGMSRKRQGKFCADIANSIRKQAKDTHAHDRQFNEMSTKSARDRRVASPSDLGKRIMAKRNANYKP